SCRQPPRVRDGRRRRQRPAAHEWRSPHAASLVTARRHHHLHGPSGNARFVGHRRRRFQSTPPHRRPRPQSWRGVGTHRPPSRVPVESSGRVQSVRGARGRVIGGDCHHARLDRVDKSLLVAATAVIRLQRRELPSVHHGQGGIMFTRRRIGSVVALLVLVVVMASCAKRPATIAASAPAPTGVAGATGPSGGSGGSGSSGGGGTTSMQPGGAGTATPTPSTTGGARPAPRDFAAISDLKDIFFDF